ncbi:MAG TPA: hypothetical protein VK694_06215 [Verrucomicrobiae bacterium]|nr:hypothetical protein [Verrucomicrobiae bacterium]
MTTSRELLDAVDALADGGVFAADVNEPGQYSMLYNPASDDRDELLWIQEHKDGEIVSSYDPEEWVGGLAVACQVETTPEEVSEFTVFLKGRLTLDNWRFTAELRHMIRGESRG